MGKKSQSVQVAPRNAGLHASLSPANHSRKNRAASSMVLVLVVTAAGALLVAGVLSWISTNNSLTERLNKHQACMAAAGAATEKVACRILRDFQTYDNVAVSNNIGTYRTLIPSSNDLVSAAKGWLIGS
ncbi:MAG TPA: hypothetical protein VK615_01060, partial [Candidatus Binatia bacterium]|nr:hypothetical protein [Candidatus Binatia bacterium]